MLKFNRIVCALIVCVSIGVVYGRASKILVFVSVEKGLTESPDSDGVAILNFITGQQATHVQISYTALLPNEGYFLTVDPGIVKEAISTNRAGNGQYQSVINFDIFSNNNIPCVYIWRDDDGNGLRTADEHRSIGCTG